ncbi:MAG: hypothetical protein EBT98_11915, partial [Opitutaceae bacterium]|nr:hypothetical protein [Opitutaceae bacterium]
MIIEGLTSTVDRTAVSQYWNRKWGIIMDSDSDGVPDTYDAFPSDETKVVGLPLLLSPLSSALKLWLTTTGNHNRNTVATDSFETTTNPLVVSDLQVLNWFDWSGNRNHMVAPANAKPVFNPNGINNMPSIQFNGIDQYMTGSPGPLVAGDDSYTLFVVWKSISTSPQVLWEQNSATGNVSGQRAA